ncbi:hypothetical protein OSTOST_12099, partial [Ostertagia ostertagi]
MPVESADEIQWRAVSRDVVHITFCLLSRNPSLFFSGKFRAVSSNGTRNGDDPWQRSANDVEMNMPPTFHVNNQVHPQ